MYWITEAEDDEILGGDEGLLSNREPSIVAVYNMDEYMDSEIEYRLKEDDESTFIEIMVDKIFDEISDEVDEDNLELENPDIVSRYEVENVLKRNMYREYLRLNQDYVATTDLIRSNPQYLAIAKEVISDWVQEDNDLGHFAWEYFQESFNDFIYGLYKNYDIDDFTWEDRNGYNNFSGISDFDSLYTALNMGDYGSQDPDIYVYDNHDGSFTVQVDRRKYEFTPVEPMYEDGERVLFASYQNPDNGDDEREGIITNHYYTGDGEYDYDIDWIDDDGEEVTGTISESDIHKL